MSPQAIGHTLTLVPLREQIVVLVLLLGCGLWASRAKTRLALVAVAACAIFWLRANSHLEGLVLVSFSPAHGLTLADLLVPLVAALVLSGQTERRRNERERRNDGRVGGRRSDDPKAGPKDSAVHGRREGRGRHRQDSPGQGGQRHLP